MWRPERLLNGPRVARADDVPSLNRVFSDSFTDRYRRDGLVGVRVPQLNPDIWRYAIEDAGDGAMLWFDESNDVVAFNIAHSSGAEGWMGPLAVRTDRQGMGAGRVIVETATEWLRGQGVTTIGLETMPRTVENIGFYGRLGFQPGHLTVTMTGEGSRRRVAGEYMRLGELGPSEWESAVDRCRERLGASAPGYDFTREIELTRDLEIGDTVVLERDGAVVAFALYHTASLAAGRPAEELRVLKLFADCEDTFTRLIVVLESRAAAAHLRRVAIRCQTAGAVAYRALLGRSYQVRWTDLRMTLAEYPEAALPEGEILLSNWEI